MIKPYVIGITGGSASGKTLFINNLLQFFPAGSICYFSQDHYFKPIHQQPKDEGGIEVFDSPESLYLESYAEDLKSLLNGMSVKRKEYTFNNPGQTPSEIVFQPSPVIIVEGIFIFYQPEIRKLFNLKIFIEAKENIKLQRRIERDRIERNIHSEDVLYRYERHITPGYEKYIAPLKEEVDFIVPNNTGFTNALEVIVGFLKTKIV